MSWVVSTGLVIAAIIHLIPAAGIAGPEMLRRLYGLDAAPPDLLIMMRHRALLFLILGGFLLIAAFRPGWQAPAIVAGLISAIGFIAFAWSTGGYSASLQRIVTADVIAVAALLVAGGVVWIGR